VRRGSGSASREGLEPLARIDPLLQRYAAFLVDVDGVLTRGSDVLPGAAEAFGMLRDHGRPAILTNNSTRAQVELSSHLRSLGFDVPPADALGTAFLAARYLAHHWGRVRVWVLGEEGIRREMVLRGHDLAACPEDAAWVVVGIDRQLTYEKLSLALRALLAGARFLATNEDATFPTPGGLVPGAGALVGALRGMGFAPECVVGKPAPAAFEVALDVLDLPASQVLMIGDRLETDIAGAQAAGLDTALVLSGVCTMKDAEHSDIRPTWIAATLADLCRGRCVQLGRGFDAPGSGQVGSAAR
jgi:HAD superfamily hydrolase (TIGR01450 family)